MGTSLPAQPAAANRSCGTRRQREDQRPVSRFGLAARRYKAGKRKDLGSIPLRPALPSLVVYHMDILLTVRPFPGGRLSAPYDPSWRKTVSPLPGGRLPPPSCRETAPFLELPPLPGEIIRPLWGGRLSAPCLWEDCRPLPGGRLSAPFLKEDCPLPSWRKTVVNPCVGSGSITE